MAIAMATFIVVAIFIECAAAIRNHLLKGGGFEAYWPDTEKRRQQRFEKMLTELVAQLQTGREGQASTNEFAVPEMPDDAETRKWKEEYLQQQARVAWIMKVSASAAGRSLND